jgi:hypothetical protein
MPIISEKTSTICFDKRFSSEMLLKQNNVRQIENKKRFSDQVKCEMNKVVGANIIKNGAQQLTSNFRNSKKLRNNNITLVNLLMKRIVSKFDEKEVIASKNGYPHGKTAK